MAQNDFLQFDENNENVLTQDAYREDEQRISGAKSGVARSSLFNKVLRQVSTFVAGFGQFIAEKNINILEDIDSVKNALTNVLSSKNIGVSTEVQTLLGADNVDDGLKKLSTHWELISTETVTQDSAGSHSIALPSDLDLYSSLKLVLKSGSTFDITVKNHYSGMATVSATYGLKFVGSMLINKKYSQDFAGSGSVLSDNVTLDKDIEFSFLIIDANSNKVVADSINTELSNGLISQASSNSPNTTTVVSFNTNYTYELYGKRG